MAYPGSYREPPARSRHFAAPLGENLYIWGGESETEDNLSLRAEFARYDPLSEQWSKFPIDGNSLTPPGLTNGACTSSDKSFYTYGGFSTVSFQSSLTGSLFEFNAQSASWTQLSVGYSQSSFSPTMKYGCKMVHYEGKLVLFGGCSTYQTGYTNELHLFNLNTSELNFQKCPSHRRCKLGVSLVTSDYIDYIPEDVLYWGLGGGGGGGALFVHP